MALKRLTTGEMVRLTQTWVEHGSADHALLVRCPETAPLVPRLSSVIQALLAAQVPVEPRDTTEVTQQLAGADSVHDDKARATYFCLLAHLYAEPDAAKRVPIQQLIDLLFPTKLNIINLAYDQEASEGLVREARAKEVSPKLAHFKLTGTHALEQYTAWNSAARTLGDLYDQRASVPKVESNLSAAVTARNNWIRVVNGIVNNLEVSDLDEATVTEFLAKLRAAELLADRRSLPAAVAAPTPAGPHAPPVGTPVVAAETDPTAAS